MPFSWCLCALFIELSTSLELQYNRVRPSAPWCDLHHKNYITNIGIPWWAPAEMTCVARLVDSEPPRLQPKSLSVVTENKENNDTLSYQY